MDRAGNVIWDRKYNLNISTPGSKFYAICSANNNDQIIGGAIAWTECIAEAPYVCRMAPNGMTIWEYRWDSLYPGQSINKVEVFHDTTYLLHLNSVTVQINNSGQIISTMFPTGNFKVVDTGGFILIGKHQIIKLSDSLNVLWQSPFYSDRVVNDLIIDSTGSYEVIITDTSGNSELLPKFNAYNYPFPQLPDFDDLIFTQCSGNFDICLTVPYSETIYDRSFEWFRSGYQLSTIPVLWEIHGLQAGTYYNISSNACGSDTSGNFVLLNVPPIVSLGNDTMVCNPDTVFLDAGIGNFSYTWQDGSNSQTFLAFSNTLDTLDYYVQKNDFNGCSSSDTIKIIFEVCTDIATLDQELNVSIIPNPAKDYLLINSGNIKIDNIKIIYIHGKNIYSEENTGANCQLDISFLKDGIYFLTLKTEQGQVVKKFVKE